MLVITRAAFTPLQDSFAGKLCACCATAGDASAAGRQRADPADDPEALYLLHCLGIKHYAIRRFGTTISG